jgi:hypothetical protein
MVDLGMREETARARLDRPQKVIESEGKEA